MEHQVGTKGKRRMQGALEDGDARKRQRVDAKS